MSKVVFIILNIAYFVFDYACMGADLLKTSLCVAYGNTWTNLAQPFWAIATLGICGLKAKDIMGYTIAIMLLSGPIFMLGVTFLPV